jgi:dynein light chain LC8-type
VAETSAAHELLPLMSIAVVAVDKYKHLKDVAEAIKHAFDKKYPGSGKATEGVYHCAVGKSFASEWCY